MSYDIKIWSIDKLKIPEALPEGPWDLEQGSAYLKKKDWQIVVNKSNKIEDEDIDQNVLPFLPGISYLTELNLEPVGAPETARSVQMKVAKAIGKEVIGVIQDPQKDEIIAPSGTKRYLPPKRVSKERFSVFEMTWIFVNHSLSHKEITSKLVEYFENNLPEALPRRFGKHEPPQYSYQEKGKEHFKEYLSEHLYESVIWYPTKPVLSCDYSFAKDWGFAFAHGKKFFKSNMVSLTFDSSLLNQPGWRKHLYKVFKDISIILNPFYAEVRILHDQIYGGGTYYLDDSSETSPIAGMWKGIPQKLGQAIVVGNEYIDYLPKLKERGHRIGNLFFASVEDWASEKNVNEIIGDPPKEVVQVSPHKLFVTFEEANSRAKNEEQFPLIFPFDKEAKE